MTDSLIFHLVVTGLDMADPRHVKALDWPEADIYPSEQDGQQFLTVRSAIPVSDAVDFVLATIAHLSVAAEDLSVEGLDQDLVGTTDIANRIGVNRETVRLWSTAGRGGGNFPPALGVVNAGRKIWDWASVNEWLRAHTTHGADEIGLSRAEHAQVDAMLRCRALPAMSADAAVG